jgi:FtsP/CotA-like multicopper oxidase with cupredoxin domain
VTTAAREHQGWRAAQPFNGGLIGPTPRVRPGDRLEVTIRNGTAEQTNLPTARAVSRTSW